MKRITNRFKQNPFTTSIGIILVFGGIFTGVTAKASWTESIMAITTGIGFIYTADAKTNNTNSGNHSN